MASTIRTINQSKVENRFPGFAGLGAATRAPEFGFCGFAETVVVVVEVAAGGVGWNGGRLAIWGQFEVKI